MICTDAHTRDDEDGVKFQLTSKERKSTDGSACTVALNPGDSAAGMSKQLFVYGDKYRVGPMPICQSDGFTTIYLTSRWTLPRYF